MNAPTTWGFTPMLKVAWFCPGGSEYPKIDAVQRLVEEGSDIAVMDSTPWQSTVLKCAAGRCQPDHIKFLIDKRCDPAQTTTKPLNESPLGPGPDLPPALDHLFPQNSLEAQCNRIIHGATPLHWAAAFGNEKGVVELLKPRPNTTIKNYRGNTAGDLAEEAHHTKIAQQLKAAK